MMNRLFFFVLLFVLSIIIGCSQPDESFESADPSGLIVHKFDIGGENFEILLPKKYSQHSLLENKVIFIIPNTRYVHYLSVSSYPDNTDHKKTQLHKWTHSIPFKNGSDFQFSINQNIGSGSGGTEGELFGVVRLDQTLLSVVCRDQSEWQPKPEWCVPYIHHLGLQSR